MVSKEASGKSRIDLNKVKVKDVTVSPEEASSIGLKCVKRNVKEVTLEEVQGWFSQTGKNGKVVNVTDEALQEIRETMLDPEFDGFKFQDTLVTYQDALFSRKISLIEYINAVKFCSFLEANGGSVIQAYIRTFHKRDIVKKALGVDTDSPEYVCLCAAATRYRKNPTVCNILAQAHVPLYFMFSAYKYKAIDCLHTEMLTAKSPRDRINAADKLLLHLKEPEGLKIEMSIKTNKDTVVDQYESMMRNMAIEQKKLINSGMDLDKVANVKDSFIDAELVEK